LFSFPDKAATSTAFAVGYTRNMSTTKQLRSLNIDNINPHVKEAKYAVRGELAVRSEEYRQKLAKGDTSLPFDKVISANIGNPQQLDQKPITFFRQVLSLLEYPPLLEKLEGDEALTKALGYEKDVIERARKLLGFVGSVGAYSASTGVLGVRESVAKFIEGVLLPFSLTTVYPAITN
jgi:alanine transaminase